MKKVFAFLLSFSLLLGMSITVWAAENVNDDLSGLTEEIVTTSNDLFGDKLSREIVAGDINYNNAFKIYVGTNIFETDVTSIEEIPQVFGNDGYIYELPIYIDGSTLIVNIAKGQELNENIEFTEEERNNILNNIGKWQVTAIKYYENESVNYITELQNKIVTVPENTVLVGGLPCFRYAVALLPDEAGAIKELVPLSDVPGIENIASFISDSENSYNYTEVKSYVNQLPIPADDEAGVYGFLGPVQVKTSSNHLKNILVVTFLIIIGGISVVIYRRKISGGKV